MAKQQRRKKHMSYQRVIALGFLLLILLGAVLLSLPVAARSGEATPFIDALFTSTSATCVTGLIIYDTYSHWSLFGQLVIITLIQIGGLGFMSLATIFAIATGRRIGLARRGLLRDAGSSLELSGAVRTTRNIVVLTFIFEGIGAAVMAIPFIRDFGVAEGIYYGIFHSISAFCNAGFDLMGRIEPFSSLTYYSADILVIVPIMLLITIGGLGFFVWEDVRVHRLRFKKYTLHSKMVLTFSAFLIVVPALLIFLMELPSAPASITTGIEIKDAIFQAISPRTAGFNTVDLTTISGASLLVIMVLMVIGGSPGSTAGGLKTTTVLAIVLSVTASMRQGNSLHLFSRRLDDDVLKRCTAIAVCYFCLAIVSIIFLIYLEAVTLDFAAFEVFSALSTVGLSLGITPHLHMASKILLSLLMFFGRVGILSIIMLVAEGHKETHLEYPREKIMIG